MAEVKEDQDEKEKEPLSVDQIVRNTWKNALGSWDFRKGGKKEKKSRGKDKEKPKKNPILEMMVNMATKSAARFVTNKLGLTSRNEKVGKEKKSALWSTLWSFGIDPKEKSSNINNKLIEDNSNDIDETESAIFTLDLDKLL